ncbi:helix-turn-helix domain-containing protein [Candidatus Poriferisocius sp.]|uniref:helix-turn-helix domain-containing protein n=1 Tax=Candidatus Poriferisocius sp. TaxID=3101276 RepID=UPI003B5C6E22
MGLGPVLSIRAFEKAAGVRPSSASRALGNASVASTLVRTARLAMGVTVAELAEAAGCEQELLVDIESGRVDPTLDTVGRIVNSVGLELRAGPAHHPHPTNPRRLEESVAHRWSPPQGCPGSSSSAAST